jgi:hypothetical protein
MNDAKGTQAEFYIGDSAKHIAVVNGVGAVPREGEMINIEKATYRVKRVTWCVDYRGGTPAGGLFDPRLRANIVITEI